ncbi:MAG: hypothetical protein J2P18_04640 [Nocardia sp.]|nr:hypothetical protein [Nocardia sp.]
MSDIAPWLASVSTWIVRRATDYTPALDSPGRDEGALLEVFDGHVEAVLTEFSPPGGHRHADGLIFAHLYAAARDPAADEQGWRVPSAILVALLAAETEFRGPLRSGVRHTILLAEVYERCGAQLSAVALPGHAALAYRRAAALYRIAEDLESEDRCALALARARTLTLPAGVRRLGRRVSDMLCGYGYLPFRLLVWLIVEVAVFGVLVRCAAPGQDVGEWLYTVVTSFLNPTGIGDTDRAPGTRLALAAESWAGAVSMSIFFALLVRKWFRL